MTRQTSPIEPAVLKPYRDADEAGPGQRFKGQILQVRDMLHQPEVTLRGCAREAVPVTESFGKHARRCYLKKNNGSKLKIIPLGGLEQIGMNITVFEYEDSIIVVDCGLAFPEDDMLGIDLVIPDVTYLKENIAKDNGYF
jgi:ribonuclease J